MDAFPNLRCCYSTWWHHELDITTTYSTISNTWPNKITWLQSFLHKLCTIPTSICKHLNFRSTFIALATLVLVYYKQFTFVNRWNHGSACRHWALPHHWNDSTMKSIPNNEHFHSTIGQGANMVYWNRGSKIENLKQESHFTR